MVRDIRIHLCPCAFILLGGSSQASHIPVVQYLPYGDLAPMDSLQKQKDCHDNSDLHSIKIIKIGSWSLSLFKKYKVQSEPNGL